VALKVDYRALVFSKPISGINPLAPSPPTDIHLKLPDEASVNERLFIAAGARLACRRRIPA